MSNNVIGMVQKWNHSQAIQKMSKDKLVSNWKKCIISLYSMDKVKLIIDSDGKHKTKTLSEVYREYVSRGIGRTL